jgi:hypothetical protein
MPDASAAPAATPPPVVKPADDPRFARTPTVRHAMILLIPKSGGSPSKVSLTEIKTGARLEVTDGSAFERTVDLNVPELRQLSDFCNRIARRVALRPDWKP